LAFVGVVASLWAKDFVGVFALAIFCVQRIGALVLAIFCVQPNVALAVERSCARPCCFAKVASLSDLFSAAAAAAVMVTFCYCDHQIVRLFYYLYGEEVTCLLFFLEANLFGQQTCWHDYQFVVGYPVSYHVAQFSAAMAIYVLTTCWPIGFCDCFLERLPAAEEEVIRVWEMVICASWASAIVPFSVWNEICDPCDCCQSLLVVSCRL